MLKAWKPAEVSDRYLRHARSIVAAGITIRHMGPQDRTQLQKMGREHLVGTSAFTLSKDDGGLVAHDKGGNLIGGIVVTGLKHDDGTTLFIRYVVVSPAWRGQGVGVVLVGMIPHILTTTGPLLVAGNCAPADAAFYQRAGFTVLDPGQMFPFPFGGRQTLALNNDHYSCWFFNKS